MEGKDKCEDAMKPEKLRWRLDSEYSQKGRVHELQICLSFVRYVCLFGVFQANKYWLALNFCFKCFSEAKSCWLTNLVDIF